MSQNNEKIETVTISMEEFKRLHEAAEKLANHQPVVLPMADKEKLINDMGRAYALLENPKRICKNCGGDGREPDDTPCSNPNERGKCDDCNGRGHWQAEPTYSDRIRAAFAVVEPYLRPTEREASTPYLPMTPTEIRVWRKHMQFSQRQAATYLNKSYQQYAKYETGDALVPYEIKCRLLDEAKDNARRDSHV